MTTDILKIPVEKTLIQDAAPGPHGEGQGVVRHRARHGPRDVPSHAPVRVHRRLPRGRRARGLAERGVPAPARRRRPVRAGPAEARVRREAVGQRVGGHGCRHPSVRRGV